MIKGWLIKASAPMCGTDTYYRAYSKESPDQLKDWDEICDEIIDELWANYSWLLHLEDEEYDSEEERQEAEEQAWEDWRCDCEVYVEKEATEEDFHLHAPGGDINALEIVHNERD